MCGFEAFVQDETACNNERENQREKTPSPIVLRVKSYGSGIQSTAEGSLSYQFPPPLDFNAITIHSVYIDIYVVFFDQKLEGWTRSLKGALRRHPPSSHLQCFFPLGCFPLKQNCYSAFFGSCYFYIKYFWEKQMDTLKEKGFLLSSFVWLFMIAHGFLWVLIIDNNSGSAIIDSHYEGKR